MIKVLNRLWNSPTLTTWASLVVISTNTIVVLPMILVKFSTIETKIYLVLATIIQFKNIFDFGLKENLSRLFSYANAGVKNLNEFSSVTENNSAPNSELISTIFQRSKLYYRYIFLFSLLFISILTYFSLRSSIVDQMDFWYACLAVVIGSAFFLYSNLYISILIGLNKVALVKRWEVLLKGLSALSLVVVMLINPTLLSFMLVLNIWIIINFFNYYFLAKRVIIKKDSPKIHTTSSIDKTVFNLSWRSSIAGFAGTGTQQGLNLLIANLVPVDIANAYLLTDRIFGQLKEVSRAPFYSKIPEFAKLRGQGKIALMIKKVRFSMGFSYVVNILGLIILLFFGNIILDLIGSKVHLVDNSVFSLMALFLFIERYTAMHTQLYTFMNNAIIAHFRIIATGSLTIILMYVLFPIFSIKALPLSSSIAYLTFFTVYVVRKNYDEIEQSFFTFEKQLIIPVGLLFIIFVILYEILIPHTQ
ncbi:hypothetical protein MWU78_00385 [Arenibacter sp. F26102]|uniref:lipopolysaccharide biosynthesis protein n=1 Tax=Arenibacter sp. F26102 TaxID=2926416 RepID=UPI001FF1618E|nr:hypothetical protein [Arenibacter sp. F26102]MCK0144101.1 hypothetical protein [Arenibacter sp. F26102]